MQEITPEVVAKIARLANLELSAAETALYAGQLEKILEHIHQLNALNTQGVAQTAHALPLANVWREDVVTPGLSREDALAAAPDAFDHCYRVPRIIE